MFNLASYATTYNCIYLAGSSSTERIMVDANGNPTFQLDGQQNLHATGGNPLNTWAFLAVTYTGILSNTINIFVNNRSPSTWTQSSVGSTTGGVIYFGNYCGYSGFYGSIANVQIYNASLTADQVQYLYKEGIGGAPIYLQRLVGWWPLNGDTIDYSGNNNNGVPAGITFNGNWAGGYYP